MNVNFNRYVGKTLELPHYGIVKILAVQLRAGLVCSVKLRSNGKVLIETIHHQALEKAWEVKYGA